MILPMLTMLLLIMTWLGWQAIYSSILGYQSTTTSSMMTQQFFLAEHALIQAEKWLQHTPAKQLPIAVENCNQSPCILIATDAQHYPQQPAKWWQTTHLAIKAARMDIPVVHDAYYVIEHLQDAHTPATRYYRITAWALLHYQTTPAVLQSVWKKSLHPVLLIKEERAAWRRWDS